MIKHLQKVIILVFLFLSVLNCPAQLFSPKNYPRDYFIYPVVATRGLSANYGELRPNHYHMGLDCRTDQAQNKQVLAAAGGYIAKVKIEPWGFGRAIYIDHPNGLTTLYAHLNDFFPALEKYVKQQQYALKSWAVFLDIPANLFPVLKGDAIALSGNTGGSQGPHLHFEIRDTKTDKTLNPLLFDFQIPDTVAPDVFRLAMYDRNSSTYEQAPKLFALKKKNGVYVTVPSLIIAKTNKLSFGIGATDRVTGSNNRNGIYETVLYQNDKPVIGFQIDSISYDETRYMNAHIDYKHKSAGRGYLQHVSQLQGYTGGIYKSTGGDGVITLTDTMVQHFKLEVKDAHGNTSVVQFEVKLSPDIPVIDQAARAAYFQQTTFHPGFINLYENSNIHFYLAENCLYDSMRFQFREINSSSNFPVFQIHNTSVPVQCYFPVTIKATTAVPDKMIMHRFSNGKNDYKKAQPVSNGKDAGWFRAGFREFGSFQLMIDTIPPTITPVGFKNGMQAAKLKQLVFVVTDNTEEINNFTATLNGNWLRFSNDKGRRFIYVFDENCPPGDNELKIIAEDQVGNKTEKNYRFTR